MDDNEFIEKHRSKIINFKPKVGSRSRGLPVGKYLIITSGFTVYNASPDVRMPLFKTKFEHITDAYEFCKALQQIYKHLLVILSDPRYSETFFLITRYSIPNGEEIYEKIRSFDDLDIIRRPDLAFILDK